MRHVFQPVVDLRAGRVVGFEALARFPGRGPQAVLAEISAAGDAALRAFDAESVAAAARAARPWLPAGTRLFLNLTHASLAAAVAGAPLPATGGVPAVWELAENAATHAVLSAPGAWGALAQHRADWALDDVGDGRADLGRLAAAIAHGVRWVKVARPVVQGAARDAARRRVLRALAGLGAAVVAEGMESAEDLAAVAEAGVRYVQGFAVGYPAVRPAAVGPRPVPAAP